MVVMARVFCLLFVLNSLRVVAKDASGECDSASSGLAGQASVIMKALEMPVGGCADASKIKVICESVYKKWPGPKGSDYVFGYEKMIHDAACVRANDSEELIQKKVQYMWNKLETPYLKCGAANFDVPRGGILKYALKMENYDFLSLAVEDWRVNLNSLDQSDNGTLLDYVRKEIDRVKGSKYETQLKAYYEYLKSQGAKHREDLP